MSTAKRRKLKKAVIGWLCIAALAANMTTPDAPLHEFTQITANAEVPTGFEDVTPMNLSNIANCTGENTIVDGITVALKKIYSKDYYEIRITAGGNYAFKGSNYINNSYADIQFVVAENITANLYFDDVYIKNDNGDFSGSTDSIFGCIKPFNIGTSATANLSGNLCIDTYSYVNYDIFLKSDLKEGNGTLNGLHTVTYKNESAKQFEEVYCTSGADAKLAGYECFTPSAYNITANTQITARKNHNFDNNKCTVCEAIKINETTFPDENFRKFVSDEFDSDNDGVLSAGEIAEVTEIECSGKEIADLTGIKYFTALENLDCSNNTLTSLDLTGFTKLGILNCSNNDLTSLDLTGCTQLYMLNCSNNNLISLDLTGYTNTKMNITFSGNTYNIDEVDDEYDLKALIERYGGDFSKVDKESVNGATLTEDGKLTNFTGNGTITYYYDTGNGNMNVTLTYTASCEHVAGTSVKTNIVAPTCTYYGYYTRITYCALCGGEMRRKIYYTMPTGHDCTSGGICKTCGALANGRDGFKSASLTLTDGVILNYYLLLSDKALADEKAYIHFTSPQGVDSKIMLSEGIEDNGRYKFSLELRPDQMADEITAQVVYSDDVEGNSINYSVQTYLDNADSSVSELADAMMNFGAFTQLYTGRNTDNLVADVADYTVNAVIGNEYKHQLSGSASGISVKGATLQIGAYTTIRVKYQLADGADINDFTFRCGDTVLEPEKSGDYYYVYIRNIRPQNLDEMYSFTVTDGTNTTTLKYSAFSYMKNILDNADKYDKNIVNLMNAMYDYNKAADAYNN